MHLESRAQLSGPRLFLALGCSALLAVSACSPSEGKQARVPVVLSRMDEAAMRESAWAQLTEGERARVGGDWEDARVEVVYLDEHGVEHAADDYPKQVSIEVRVSFDAMGRDEPVVVSLEPRTKERLGAGEPSLDAAFLDDPTAAADAFLRVRASTEPGAETFFHWTGTIHELRPDLDSASYAPLLRFEGFNVARVVQGEDGHRLLTREITVYQDADGAIIDCWRDPSAPEGSPGLPVFHTRNDPVSFDLRAPGHRVLHDRVLFSVTIPLAYPSPLETADYPDASNDDTYRSMELFDFEAALADLADPAVVSVPTRIVWARVGQWLPWMGRGQQPGWLVYHATGHKLEGGWDELPEPLRSWTTQHVPEYRHAPEEDVGPNQTSWSAYRRAAEAGELAEGCGG